MKILISADTYFPQVNGASYFTQRLAQAMAQRGHQVVVIAPGLEFKTKVIKQGEVIFHGIPSIKIPFIYNFRLVLPMFSSYFIKKVVNDFKPDVTHIQMHFTISRSCLKYSKRKNIPVVATNHFMPENLSHYFGLPKYFGEFLNKLAWKDCARVLSRSNSVTSPTIIASDLLSRHLNKKVHPISNGIDLSNFYPRIVRLSFKQKYSLPENYILFVGRLDKEKNIDVIIDTIKILKNKDIHLVIAGNGNEKQTLINRVSRNIKDQVHFLGFVNDADLPYIYAAAKSFINMGTAELQSIVTMEAMATGLPIIGAHAVALPELIKNYENGLLVEPGNILEVAQAINYIFSDEDRRIKMGEKSIKLVQIHDIKKVVLQYEDLYKKM